MTRPTHHLRGHGVAGLTPAERQVIEAAALGLSTAATAARLNKTLETVKSQRKLAIARLGAANMTNAVWILALAGRSPWSCQECGGERSVEEWPKPCARCGSVVMRTGVRER